MQYNAALDHAGHIKDSASGNVRAVIRRRREIIWIEPSHSATVKEALAKAAAKIREG